MDQNRIGVFILERRRAKGLTQAQLAERLGITDRAVSKWETGKSLPDASIMLELCRILEGEGTLQELDVDQWLFWVRREEESGKKFAAAEEFLEDMAEFSRLASFRYDPYVGRFFRKRGSTGMLALLLFLFPQ